MCPEASFEEPQNSAFHPGEHSTSIGNVHSSLKNAGATLLYGSNVSHSHWTRVAAEEVAGVLVKGKGASQPERVEVGL